MAETDDVQELARQLLAAALPAERTTEGAGRALRVVSQHLVGALSAIFGSLGVRTMLTLVLGKAGNRQRFLAGATVYDDGIEVAKTVKAGGAIGYDEARAAVEDLLVAFAQQLADFVGDDLAAVLVREAASSVAEGRDARQSILGGGGAGEEVK